jgi:hypothetical protein
MQPLSPIRRAGFARGFFFRALLVAIVVSVTHQFAWGGLRYVTSETVLRLSEFAGLSTERLSADTIRVQGSLFQFVISCTFVDVILGMIPLVWVLHKSVARNLLTVIPLAIGLFSFNLVRLEIAQLLYARGLPWFLSDDVLGGIAYFAVWILIVSWFSKYWRQTFQLRSVDRTTINTRKTFRAETHIAMM